MVRAFAKLSSSPRENQYCGKTLGAEKTLRVRLKSTSPSPAYHVNDDIPRRNNESTFPKSDGSNELVQRWFCPNFSLFRILVHLLTDPPVERYLKLPPNSPQTLPLSSSRYSPWPTYKSVSRSWVPAHELVS